MERFGKRILPTAVAVGAGVLTLLGYLLPVPPFTTVRDEMVQWAVIVAAFAFILGFFNVLRVHLGRLARRASGWGYSLVLILTALISLLITAAGLVAEPARAASDWWFGYVLYPLQAAAAGLVAIVLAFSAFRLLRHRRSAETLFFLVAALVVLLGTTPLPGVIGERLAALRQWWMEVPAMAGMRGFLIGVGLGTLLMGLRVITGMDRPHSDV
ncbi:MAG TPA: hypothetical protein G4O00_05590 [Thermoflexia bacterium]|jgi:hypothetical protein|nr:hypothetical protein [Thermoflexia bacterium]